MRQRLIRWLVLLLFLLLPTQLGYHFWPTWSLVNGVRVDYLSPTVYLTDLIILLMMVITPPLNPPLNLRGGRKGVIFIIFAVINVVAATNPVLAGYRWLRVYEYFWLFKYLTFEFDWKFKIINWSLPLAILWTSGLAWIQFLLQRSVGGWLYWLGERTFSITTPGIAKVFVSQLGLVLRPYATLPHPNALAGWLLVAGLLVGGWPLVVGLMTIPITFSRSAILLLPALLWRKSKMTTIFLFSILWALFSNLGNPASLSERQTLNVLAVNAIPHNFWFGVGLGNFIPSTAPLIRQPVHNIYLLTASELGLPAFLLILYLVIKNLLSIKNFKLKIALLFVLATGALDHYWLTLHQNSLLLVVLLATVKITSDGIKNKL